jgi:hypothetical protein
VSQHVKEQWTEKYQRALDRLQLDDN